MVDIPPRIWYILKRLPDREGENNVPAWLDIFLAWFEDTLGAHAALAVFLFAVMEERDWQRLKKLPGILLSSALATLFSLGLEYSSVP